MIKDKRKILILVEGENVDVRLMGHLMKIYNIDIKYEIVSYKTNIYALYNEMFKDDDPESMDILQILKAREKDLDKKQIFNEKYTDILLIFDLDPQDPLFSGNKISKMIDYFVDSSDMGKLYINYPMVEAFYHMSSIPDEAYLNCCAKLTELKSRQYKKRVNIENRNRNYEKFAVNRYECNTVIQQNIEKAHYMVGRISDSDNILPQLGEVLTVQLNKLIQEECIFVLCTCVFFIVEYNSKLIFS